MSQRDKPANELPEGWTVEFQPGAAAPPPTAPSPAGAEDLPDGWLVESVPGADAAPSARPALAASVGPGPVSEALSGLNEGKIGDPIAAVIMGEGTAREQGPSTGNPMLDSIMR